MSIQPFKIAIPQAILDDLRERLAAPVGPTRSRAQAGSMAPISRT